MAKETLTSIHHGAFCPGGLVAIRRTLYFPALDSAQVGLSCELVNDYGSGSCMVPQSSLPPPGGRSVFVGPGSLLEGLSGAGWFANSVTAFKFDSAMKAGSVRL